jgi:hypothetical protein
MLIKFRNIGDNGSKSRFLNQGGAMSTVREERVAGLPDMRVLEDPREVAADLTLELAELTAERSRLIQDGGESCEISEIDRGISLIHARLNHLQNHC